MQKKGKLVFKNQIEQGRGKIYGDVNILETYEYLKFSSIIRSIDFCETIH